MTAYGIDSIDIIGVIVGLTLEYGCGVDSEMVIDVGISVWC